MGFFVGANPPIIRGLTKFFALFLSLLLISATCAFALPEPEEVVSGTAEFSYPDNTTLNINASDRAIINYRSFDIRENESVIINLPDVNNAILNRVLGDKASDILGNLTCNGIFVLVNRNGIYFGPKANIDVGGLIASTRDITNSDFLDSKYVFGKMSGEQLDSLLLNAGTINIRRGGFGVLIAGAVENQGTIISYVGTVAMAAGDMVRLDISGNRLISLAIDQPTASTIVDRNGNPVTDQLKNTGTINADGGMVLLKAESITDVFRKVINLDGYIKADRLENHDGEVRIVSNGNVSINGTISATRIHIGKKDEAVPQSVDAQNANLIAQSIVSVIADRIAVKTQSPLTEIYKTMGDMSIISAARAGDLITLEGDGLKVTYLMSNA